MSKKNEVKTEPEPEKVESIPELKKKVQELEQKLAVDGATCRDQASKIDNLKKILLAVSGTLIQQGNTVQNVGFDIQGAIRQIFPEDFRPQQPQQPA